MEGKVEETPPESGSGTSATQLEETSGTREPLHAKSEEKSNSGIKIASQFENEGVHCEASASVQNIVDQTENSEEDPEFENEGSTTSSGDSELENEFNWRPIAGEVGLVEECLAAGIGPRDIIPRILPNFQLPAEAEESALWHLIIQVLTEPPKREKLTQYNTYSDAIDLIRQSKKILVLTGAGISVSCGIPDFRSKDGIYARLHTDFPDLPDPQSMFDINFFHKNPLPFYSFAKEIYPGKFEPSPCHKFLALLEKQEKMLRNYTQNIDTLEQVAGITKVIQCHGSFATASCCSCKRQVDCEVIRADIENSVVPKCSDCPPDTEFPIMKPDIVFFGEGLPREFHDQLGRDKTEVDLLIVIGSSLKVRPVALIPNSIPAGVPQILINNEPLKHLNFDIELIGSCDEIIEDICLKLGEPWSVLSHKDRVSLDQILLEVTRSREKSIDSNDGKDELESDAKASETVAARELKDSVVLSESTGHPGSSTDNNNTNESNEPSPKMAKIDETSSQDQSKPQQESIPPPNGSGKSDPKEPEKLPSSEASQGPEEESCEKSENGAGSSDSSIEELIELVEIEPLPPNSFYLIPPNRSIFPGAKILSEPPEASTNDTTCSSTTETDTSRVDESSI